MTISRFAVLGALIFGVASPAVAQNEEALKAYFEGHRVTLRLDMPGTSDGVDVHADAKRAFDYGEYKDHLRKYGTAIRAGQSAMVTLVKIKKDLIEFQLDGGGYGTFGDDTSTSVYMPLVEKSERERELERKIRDEDDRERRRAMQRELDDLRDRRERENRRIEVEKERAEERKAERLAERRLTGGSRFNLRYEDRVPAGMRPVDVMAALGEYVDFGNGAAMAIEPMPAADVTALRKGMTRTEVEHLFGRAAEVWQRTTGDVTVVTLVFSVNSQRVSVEFVEDVLVRYTISSK
jgi:hypothetical protein